MSKCIHLNNYGYCDECKQDACKHNVVNSISGVCSHCKKQIHEQHQSFAERPSISPNMNVVGYEDLERIFQGAYEQSASGKGKDRHANNQPFNKQPIMEIGRMVGIGGHTYQICKKAQESGGMVGRNEFEAAKAELRGVMVYAAAAILLIEGMDE